jgi:TetR/AcrR family transcriptional regulator, fatty acid metabolism regulator protein
MSGHSAAPVERPRGGGGKRQRILDAAVRVFAEKGFYGSKVAEIARAARVADGTIYLYFKSKDDLLISLFEDRMAEINGALRAALAPIPSALGKLRRLIEMHLELVEKHPKLCEVLTVELRQSSKFMREYKNPKFGEFLKILAGVIDDGQRSGELRPGISPTLAARAIFGALDELLLARALGRAEPIPKGAVVDLLIHGVVKERRHA